MTTIGGAPFPSTFGCLGADLTGHSGQTRSGPFNRPKIGACRDVLGQPLLCRAHAVVLAVEAADRWKRIHELPIAAVAIAPIRGICQLQHPATIPIEDRGCERIPQPRPAVPPAIHGVEDRLHTLLLAERTPAIHCQRLLIKPIKKFLDLGQYVITLRAQSAILIRTPRREVVQRALETVHSDRSWTSS